MRRLLSLPLVLFVAAGIHVDWHLARPLHHRLSLAWEHHWMFGAALFLTAACWVAWRWPEGADRWRAGALNVGLALVAAQLLEPLGESIVYVHRLGLPVEPARWAAFGECVAAGLPAFALGLWLCPRLLPRRPAPGLA